jgi:cathepsin X
MGSARHDATPLPAEVITSPLPEEYLRTESLPVAWDWRSVKVAYDAPPAQFTTRVRNQFLPLWCGSCWAHAAAAVLGSRWRIHLGNMVDVSVQYFVNCVDGTEADPNHPTRGCNGGSSYEAFGHAHKFGAVDSSCLPYTAVTNNCTARNTCQQNLNGHDPHITTVSDPVRFYVGDYGLVGTFGKETPPVEREAAMLKEIYARGPIASCMACPSEFENEYTSGVYVTNNTRDVCDHLVAIVGFGGQGTGAYWIVQNSFGSTWGEFGFFRIKRASALAQGEHNLGIGGQRVSWAMPASA